MSAGKIRKHRAINTDMVLVGTDISSDLLQVERLKERPEVKHIKLSSSKDLQGFYKFGEEIGKGNFGTVLSVTDKTNDKEWAMKVITKSTIGPKLKQIQQEIHILKMVKHPHIIHLERVYETGSKIYLILERCLEELAQRFKRNKPFTETDARKVVSEVASALTYLHKYDIVHRDLKLENLLLALNPMDPTDSLYVKITDFGLSVIKQGTRPQDMLTDCCGTLAYMPPEMITSSSYSQQCDIWSTGVILYVLLTARFPFFGKNEKELQNMICKHELRFEEFRISKEAVDLIKRMLDKNPAIRITATEIMGHPWLKGTRIADDKGPPNVLDMMHQWRTEMMVPTVGEESDWLMTTRTSVHKLPPSSSSIHHRRNKSKPSVDEGESHSVKRQSIPLAVQNIHFDKSNKETPRGRPSKQRERESATSRARATPARRKSNDSGGRF